MATQRPVDAKEPEIKQEDILFLRDDNFCSNNVCVVTGAATGIGRATAIAAAANKLMTVGLDINEEEGEKTQKKARDMGGQMIFIKTDLTKDEDIEKGREVRIDCTVVESNIHALPIPRCCEILSGYWREH